MRIARPASAALLVMMSARVAARVCPETGKEAPKVTTLMVSPKHPYPPVVVTPDCVVSTYEIEERDEGRLVYILDIVNGIEHVESYPSSVSTLYLAGNKIKSGDFSGTSTTSVLTLNGNQISSFDDVSIPNSVQNLYLEDNAFTSVNRFPQVAILDMSGNKISSLEGVEWTGYTRTFICNECPIRSLRGIRFQKNLVHLEIDTPVTNFEIRQSDLAMFQEIGTLKISVEQTKCADVTATIKTVKGGIKACVISDDRFEKKFVAKTVSDTDSDGTTSPSGAGSASATSESSSGSKPTADSSRSMSESGQDETGNSSSGFSPNRTSSGDSPSTSTSNESGPTASDDVQKDQTNPSDTGNSSSTLLPVLIAIGSAVLLGLAAIMYRQTSRKRRESKTEYYDSAASPATTLHPSGGPPTDSSSNEYFSNDVRNDESLMPFRIDRSDIKLTKAISNGSYGVIFLAKFHDRRVALKQLRPEHATSSVVIRQFMDEIRLCARLSHPKIVEFIGISYSSLRDLSVVIEYMAGGDLYGALRESLRRHEPSVWLDVGGDGDQSVGVSSSGGVGFSGGGRSVVSVGGAPLASSSPVRRSSIARTSSVFGIPKVRIATDVSQALTYLHSFDPPIVHRDLKARNVLLGANSEAKLSDFGISREVPLDETMTGEVGTLAWIAPEVLRGERYSEKADSYSFGVLLVEMDRRGHPYAALQGSREREGEGEGDGVGAGGAVGATTRDGMSTTQIAMLVSTGSLKPVPTAGCPAAVASLITRCLSFDPSDRPTSMELHYALRQLR